MNKQLLTFNVMTAVQSSYKAERMSDSEFAKKLSAIFKTDVSTARVRQARASLGIPNNEACSPGLKRAIDLLKEVMSPMGIESSVLREEISDFLARYEA